MRTRAPYDGLAEWYDSEFSPDPLASPTWDSVVRLLGGGGGSLLDVGCGTGALTAALAERGWQATGVDVSADMLERARARGLAVVQADATALPFDDDAFDAVVSIWTHTDVDDFAAVVREIARVLRAGGPFVYVGGHPCFVGPHSRFICAEGVPALYAGWYRHAERYFDAPGMSPEGLRARVGATHMPLGRFMQSFVEAGLRLEHFEEDGVGDYPYLVALRWRR